MTGSVEALAAEFEATARDLEEKYAETETLRLMNMREAQTCRAAAALMRKRLRPSGDVWVVLVEDRHTDVNPLPFTTEEAALAEAREWFPPFGEEIELTPEMRRDGWVLAFLYGTEGHRVRVVKRELDDQWRRNLWNRSRA